MKETLGVEGVGEWEEMFSPLLSTTGKLTTHPEKIVFILDEGVSDISVPKWANILKSLGTLQRQIFIAASPSI